MKTTIFFALFLSMMYSFQAYSRTSKDIIDQREVQRYRYVLRTSMLDVIVLNMSYGHEQFISAVDRTKLKKSEVYQIDLVFTDFPKGRDLKELNHSRIKMIEALRPDLVENENVIWKIIRQTDCKNEAEAKTMFHGIVVHFKKEQSEEERKLEYTGLSKLLPSDSLLGPPEVERKKLSDSTIIKVLERKKEWKNMAIVADMTGSMSPYVAQVVLWFHLKLNDKRVKDLVFFNDGDRKRTEDKHIGSTGGIYTSHATNYKAARELAFQTIGNGNGGDSPENDIEALLKAMSFAPKAEEYVLVVDNLSPVKDLALLSKVNKPVRIILCGSKYGINTQYLTIARATGGSVHTMEADLEDLMMKNEGERFAFMGNVYQIVGGEVVIIKSKGK